MAMKGNAVAGVGEKFASFPETRTLASKGKVPNTGTVPSAGVKGGKKGTK